MKLLVKMIDLPQGKRPVLTDEDGNMLPCQMATEMHVPAEGPGTVTVTFIIDDDRLRLA